MSSRKIKIISLSLGQILSTIINLLVMVSLARVLSPGDFATYKQTILAYDFLMPLLTLGIPSSIYYFLTDIKNSKEIVFENIIILTIMGGVFSLFLSLGGTNFLAKRFTNPELEKTLRWFIAYPIYTFPTLILSPIFVIIGKVKELTIYNVITNVSLGTFSIIACYLTKSYELSLLIKIIYPLFSLPICLMILNKYLEGKIEKFQLKNLLNILRFSIPLGLSSMISILSVQLDKIIVSTYSNPVEFAIYSNGAIEIPLIGAVTGAIGTVIMVDMRKFMNLNQKDKALLLYKEGAVKAAFILFPIMCFLFIFADNFIQILFSEKYLQSVIPFKIYLLLLPIRIMSYGNALTVLGKSKQILYRSIGDLLINLILSVILIKKIGIYGAAWATVLSIYFWNIPFNFKEISHGFNVKITEIISKKELFKILIISLSSGFVASIVKIMNLNYFYMFLFGGLIFVVAYLVSLLIFFPELKNLIVKKLNLINQKSFIK